MILLGAMLWIDVLVVTVSTRNLGEAKIDREAMRKWKRGSRAVVRNSCLLTLAGDDLFGIRWNEGMKVEKNEKEV